MKLTPLLLVVTLAATATAAGTAPDSTGAPAAPRAAATPRTPVPAPAIGADRIVTRAELPAKLTVGDRFPVTYTVTTTHPSLVTGPLADTLGAFLIADERR